MAARSLRSQPDYKRYLEHDSYGNDLPNGTFTGVSSESECQAKCSDNAECTGYVWNYKLPESSTWSKYCWLKQVCVLQAPTAVFIMSHMMIMHKHAP